MADIIGLDGKKAENKAANDNVTVEAKTPKEFGFVLHSGDVIKHTGYLVVTTTFVGVANDKDEPQIVVPIENLSYVATTSIA